MKTNYELPGTIQGKIEQKQNNTKYEHHNVQTKAEIFKEHNNNSSNYTYPNV